MWYSNDGYWNGGFGWPGFVLMAVFCLAMNVLMVRMLGGHGHVRLRPN